MRRKILITFFLIIVAMFSCSLLACKDKAEQSFNVSFYSETGELVSTVNTTDKEKFTGELSTKVEKLATEKFEYKFIGWYTSEQGGKEIKSLNDIEEETSLYPRFEEVLRRYEVRYHNAEGDVIFTSNVGYGSPSFFLGIEPEKPATNEEEYTFLEWDKDTSNVIENMDVYPVYEVQVRYYVVTFMNYDGEILQTNSYTYNSEVTYEGEVPTKPEVDAYEYEFAGWDLEVTSVTESKIYKAVYNEIIKQFLIDFYVGEELIASKIVDYGMSLTDIPDVPIVTGFTGEWDSSDFEEITENIRVNAVYTPIKYTVSFDMAGATTENCSSLVLVYEQDYILPTFNGYRFGYEFIGWERESVQYQPGQSLKMPCYDIEYTAQWRQVKYSVYSGLQTADDFVNDCKIYMFENGELVVVAKTYESGEGVKPSSFYNISVVRGQYVFENEKIKVTLNVNYNYTLNKNDNIVSSYRVSTYCEETELQASNSGDSIFASGVEYKLLSKDNYIENNILPGRQVLGVALDKNSIFLQNEHVQYRYALVIYSDLSIEIVNNFSIINLTTYTLGDNVFNVLVENSKFEFDYRVVSLEDTERLDYVSVSGDQLYQVGADMGFYFYNAQYCNGYKYESYTIDSSRISGFDTTSRGVKTLTFTLDEGVFTLDIYVVDNMDDVLTFNAYRDTYVYEVAKEGYNVFLKDSTVNALGVKYASCSVSYSKAINGADIVDGYTIAEVDVSALDLPTNECGYFRTKIDLDGKIIEVEYSVIDELTYYSLDGYQLVLEENTMLLINEQLDVKVKASYGGGSRYQYFNIDELEGVEVKGLSTQKAGIQKLHLIVDGNVVDSKQVIVFENSQDDIVEKKYFASVSDEYLYENVFVKSSAISELFIKYSLTTYRYSTKEVEYTEGVEPILCDGIDTSTIGLKAITCFVDEVGYIINYLVVEQESYETISDFEIIGEVNYLIGEDVDLKLVVSYGDDYKQQVLSAKDYILEYDNSEIGVKVLTVTYSGISKNILVYYFNSIYGFIDYSYYADLIIDSMEYKTHNIFYKGQQVSEISINQINVRRFYDGEVETTKTIAQHALSSQLDTSVLGKGCLNVNTLNSIISVEYNIISRETYIDETGYRVLGKKVLTPQDNVNIELIIEYSNGLRHEVVIITEEDLTEFSREDIGQQTIKYLYNGKEYVFALFNYVPERDEIENFVEVEFFDTSLKDYINSIAQGVAEAEFKVKSVTRVYNKQGEMISEEFALTSLIVAIDSNLQKGVNILELSVFDKVFNIQFIIE